MKASADSVRELARTCEADAAGGVSQIGLRGVRTGTHSERMSSARNSRARAQHADGSPQTCTNVQTRVSTLGSHQRPHLISREPDSEATTPVQCPDGGRWSGQRSLAMTYLLRMSKRIASSGRSARATPVAVTASVGPTAMLSRLDGAYKALDVARRAIRCTRLCADPKLARTR